MAVIDVFVVCFSFLSQHITNPRKAAGQQDLMVNNPLSQDEGVSVCGISLLFFVSQLLHICIQNVTLMHSLQNVLLQ